MRTKTVQPAYLFTLYWHRFSLSFLLIVPTPPKLLQTYKLRTYKYHRNESEPRQKYV